MAKKKWRESHIPSKLQTKARATSLVSKVAGKAHLQRMCRAVSCMQRVQRHRTLWARLPSGSVRNSKDKGEACKLSWVEIAFERICGQQQFQSKTFGRKRNDLRPGHIVDEQQQCESPSHFYLSRPRLTLNSCSSFCLRKSLNMKLPM